jgi:hypothetical protein
MDDNEYSFQPTGGQSSGANLLDSFAHLVGGASSLVSAANSPQQSVEHRPLEPQPAQAASKWMPLAIVGAVILVVVVFLIKRK